MLGPEGQTLCTDLGLPAGVRTVISSQEIVGVPGARLDILELSRGRMVRLRRKIGDGINELTALIPAELFISKVAARGGPINMYAAVTSREGAVLGKSANAAKRIRITRRGSSLKNTACGSRSRCRARFVAARGIQRSHPRSDARPDAARHRGGRRGDRTAARLENIVQFRGSTIPRRLDRPGGAQHLRRHADRIDAGRAGTDGARPDREPNGNPPRHRRVAGSRPAHRD